MRFPLAALATSFLNGETLLACLDFRDYARLPLPRALQSKKSSRISGILMLSLPLKTS